MYPELSTLSAKGDTEGTTPPAIAPTPEEMSKTLHFLIQMIQLMEDVWFAAYLETHWNDPNNLGWMNTFQRWAYTPSFRLWWPILKPMFGRKFRRFMEERLSLADEDYPPTAATVTNRGTTLPDGVAQTYWERMHVQDPEKETGKTVYSYDLQLTLQRQAERDVTTRSRVDWPFSISRTSHRALDPWKSSLCHRACGELDSGPDFSPSCSTS